MSPMRPTGTRPTPVNRLRLEIWPELEGINPPSGGTHACTADILRRENAYLDSLAASGCGQRGPEWTAKHLLAAPEALRPRMLRLLLDRLPTDGRIWVQCIWRRWSSWSPAGALSPPEGVEAVCRGGVLTLRMAETVPEETVLVPGREPLRRGMPRGEQKTMEGALALVVGAEQRLTARCWRRGGPADTAGRSRARSLKRAHGGAGRETREPPENTGAVGLGVAAAAWGIGVDRSFLPEPSGEGIYYIIMRES